MKIWLIAVLLGVSSSRRSDEEGNNTGSSHTITPFIWSQLLNDTWVCGSSVRGAILCDDDSEFIMISRCYCLYYDDNMNISQFGTCLLTCFHPQYSSYFKLKKYPVTEAKLFNENMCIESSSSFNYTSNREGRFCGRCQDGFGLTVYSYQIITCIPCENYNSMNWFKYLAIALGPLTIFYIIIVFLKINFTSSYLNGVIASSQIMVSPINLIILQGWLHSNTVDGILGLKLISSTFGILNLDFFRDIYSPFCLNPTYIALQVIALDYIPALYPFLLIFLTYVLIVLYDKSFLVLVLAWKPFKYILNKYYKNLNVRTSLVEVFASFILLSSVKIASISLLLLVPSNGYDVHGNRLPVRYLQVDSNIEWFGNEHIPYGVLAIFTGISFVLFPLLLLLLYPSLYFQNLLNYCNLNFQVLRVFMDAFQGSYKTEPYDMRYFSAYYLFVRIFILFLATNIQSIFSFPAAAICLVINCAVVSAIQPYKSVTHNKIDILAMNMLAFSYIATLMMMSTFYLDVYWLVPANAAFGIAQLLISLYLLGVLVWVLLGNWIKYLYYKLKTRQQFMKEPSIEVFDRVDFKTSKLVQSRKESNRYT